MKREEAGVDVRDDGGSFLGCQDCLSCVAECWIGAERICEMLLRLASCPCLEMSQTELESWGVRPEQRQAAPPAAI